MDELAKYDGGFHEDTLIWMADGTEKPVKDLKPGDKIVGYDTYFDEDEYPGFNGSNVVLNKLQTGVVEEVIEKEVDSLLKLNLNYFRKFSKSSKIKLAITLEPSLVVCVPSRQ